MADKSELCIRLQVDVKVDGVTKRGSITRFLPGGKCEVKFPDESVGTYPYDEMIVANGTGFPEPNVDLTAKMNAAKAKELDEREAKIKADETEAAAGKAKNPKTTITRTIDITVPQSHVTLDPRTLADPVKLAAAEKAQAKLAEKRQANRIKKLEAEPKTPVQVRKEFLEARFRRVQNRTRHNYKKEQLKVWLDEYEIIKRNPGSWKPGCVRAKRKPTAQDLIDAMKIDD